MCVKRLDITTILFISEVNKLLSFCTLFTQIEFQSCFAQFGSV